MNSWVTSLLLAGCWACCLLEGSARRLPDKLSSPPRNPIGASYSFSISNTDDDTYIPAPVIYSSSRRFSPVRIAPTRSQPQPSVSRFSPPRWNPVAAERRRTSLRTPATSPPRPQTTAAPEPPVSETPEYDALIVDDAHVDAPTPDVPAQDTVADDPVRVLISEQPQFDASEPDAPVPDVVPDEQMSEVPVPEAPVSEVYYYDYYDEQDSEPQNVVPAAPAVRQDNEKATRDQNLVQPADTPSTERLPPVYPKQAEYSFRTVYGGR